MTIIGSGEIGIDDITTEFGSDVPDDNLEEYYRGGIFVTDNNINVPTSGTISIEDFYGAQLVLARSYSSNTNNIIFEDLFSDAEWSSSAPKTVTIESGVYIGSTSVSNPSARTGTKGVALGGTLTLINNGYIYGAGGAPNSGVGGDALEADVDLTIVNNSRVWAGGGGGGLGGQGADCYYYPDSVNYQYSSVYGSFTFWLLDNTGDKLDLDYNISSPITDVSYSITQYGYPSGSGLSITSVEIPYTPDGYVYERGSLQNSQSSRFYWYSMRRRYKAGYSGGAGGSGGKGQGWPDGSALGGAAGVNPTHAGQGGTGGTGGNFGNIGNTGNTGSSGANTYHTNYVNGRVGSGGGQSGYYIISNGNTVNWSTPGSTAGRTS